MGAEFAKEQVANNMGFAQTEACVGCPVTTGQIAMNVVYVDSVARVPLAFNREEHVRTCPQVLPEELTGQDSLAACQERKSTAIAELALARQKVAEVLAKPSLLLETLGLRRAN